MGSVIEMPSNAGQGKPRPVMLSPARFHSGCMALTLHGIMSQGAYALATHVCARMASVAEGGDLALAYSTLTRQGVRSKDGGIICGPPPNDIHSYIQALQDIHGVGLLNDYVAESLDRPDITKRHFTRHPAIIAGVNFSLHTTLHFRLVRLPVTVWQQRIRDLIETYAGDHHTTWGA